MKKKKAQNQKPYQLQDNLKLTSNVKQVTINGMQTFILSNQAAPNKKQILYLHGGAYIHQPLDFHWKFLDKIVMDTNATIIVPIYPKAPEHQYKEAFDKVLPLYESLLSQANPRDIILMGDSAGGGFSLALSQVLLEKNIDQLPK